MSRAPALGNLVQAAILGGVSAWLAESWTPAAVLAGAAAGCQLLAAALVLAGRGRAARLAALATIVLVGALVGFFVQAAVFVATRFGAEAAAQGRLWLMGIGAALPWVLAWPLWQGLRRGVDGTPTRAGPLALVLALGAASLPGVARAVQARPVQAWPAQPALDLAAQAAWTRWTTGTGELPAGEGPATVLLTPWSRGGPGASVRGDGADLGQALAAALARLPPPGERPALVLDLARARHGDGRVPAGFSGGLHETGGASPSTLVQGPEQEAIRPTPGWFLRVPPLPAMDGARFDSRRVDASGVVALQAGWAEGPGLDADAALAGAIAAGDHVLHHQDADGRYAYIVLGPSGREGSGYNFPRHAGVTWFLARLAARTGEERFARGADLGLAYLDRHTLRREDGRAWVKDPKRKDGRAWAGTTALAALAAAERDPQGELATGWGAFLASSVDARGAVRGEVLEADGSFPEQALNPYGQGQTVLALAALLRAGHAELRPVVERAAAFLDGAYAPGAAGRIVVLDEHWICLTASALQDALGRPAGMGVCRGYLAQNAGETPVRGATVAVSTGPGGGLAEAIVAAAFLEPRGPYRTRALAMGQLFLDAQYRAADGPLLPRPEALIGGFRDRPWELDVRMDAVQHIGCALLGIEELLRGERQGGSRP